MRYLIYSIFLISILFLVSCSSQNDSNKYMVNLTIEGAEDTWVYMEHQIDGKWIKFDSAELKSGTAVFSGELEHPEFFFIKLKDQSNYLPAFIEPGIVTVTGSTTNPNERSVEGSKAQIEFAKITDSLNNYTHAIRELGMNYQKAKGSNDTVLMKQIENEYENLNNEKKSFILESALAHNSSVVPVFVVLNNIYSFELEELDKLESTLDPSIKNSVYVKELTKKINTLKKVSVGQTYIDFTLNNPEGNPVPLSSKVDGSYVLVDFWAAWCKPCRAENPNIVAAYNKYHKEGFDVFGVSLDRDLESWKKAIEDDGLTWTHVSDLQAWNSEAGKLYGVRSIPHNLLLDPDGIIIEKNLRGQDLQDKLAELFN